jgi:single-stranded-DNA-specific exonuclease
MKYRWSVAPAQPLLTNTLRSGLRISELLAQCLVNRGHSEPSDIETFLDPKLKRLADPFLLPNMRAAVERLFKARANDESLVIFGDYDVDGVTSTAILTQGLRALGWKINCFLPQRMEEGYGLSREGVENCLQKNPSTLLLAVDCGSTAIEVISGLKQRGIDVIVLDHHQVSVPAPEAFALVNPQLGNGPFRELCSAGLAFKLLHAVVKQGRDNGLEGAAEFDIRPFLDYVALGTIADLVPLNGENRILASMGLERLRSTARPGLVALKKISSVTSRLGAHEVGYQLAPRLNAAGRLEDAEEALNLLLVTEMADAEKIALNLDLRNRERQKIERGITEEVIGALKARFDPETDYVIVEGQLFWHIGVVGIVASRVMQQFYRPTFILGGDGDGWRGSGRSIPGFDLAAALRECDDLLVKHGGHAMAAGVSIEEKNIDAFRKRLNELARSTLKPSDLQPCLRIDAEVALKELTLDRFQELEKLQPIGQGNPPLHFVSRGVTQARPLMRMGSQKQHVKLWLTDGEVVHEAVVWGAGKETLLPVGRIDIAFAPEINEFNGKRSIQLRILDWAPAG